MSVARVVTVKKAAKDQGKCGSCGVEINKGDGYHWWKMGFRSNYKYKACLKSECFPSPSSRESSKFATIMAAQETFHSQIDNADSQDVIESLVEDVASAVEEVQSEYQDALDQWEHGNEALQEKVDHYDGMVSEIQSFQLTESEPEKEDFSSDEEFQTAHDEWLEHARQEAIDAVEGIEQA